MKLNKKIGVVSCFGLIWFSTTSAVATTASYQRTTVYSTIPYVEGNNTYTLNDHSASSSNQVRASFQAGVGTNGLFTLSASNTNGFATAPGTAEVGAGSNFRESNASFTLSSSSCSGGRSKITVSGSSSITAVQYVYACGDTSGGIASYQTVSAVISPGTCTLLSSAVCGLGPITRNACAIDTANGNAIIACEPV